MRLLVMRDGSGKLVGFGLQWRKPINLDLQTWRGRRLGLLFNYAAAVDRSAKPIGETAQRWYVRICDVCRRLEADIYCPEHNQYLCAPCALDHHLKAVCSLSHTDNSGLDEHL